jgi:uracil-DNA glycosylase
MRGTTSVLRLLFGLPLSTEHNSEFLVIDGERHHLFDSFALVNYLLCSAIPANGRMQGLATPTMKKNCGEHFREAICILEPLVIVVQGKTFWPWVRSAFDDVRHEEHEVYTARVASMQSFIAAFTHPSAPFPHNWGTNDQTPYLLQTVAPSIAWIRHQLLAEQGGRAKI